MNLIVPKNYKPEFGKAKTVESVQKIIKFFGEKLSEKLKLQKVMAPLLFSVESGISDNYHGLFPAVTFPVEDAGNKDFEVIRSVTKWKRQFLSDLNYELGNGIYSEVMGIRPDEQLSNIHSIQVDQWDWELVISKEQYKLSFLKNIVEKIYKIYLESEQLISGLFPEIKSFLPHKIIFLHSEDLAKKYPHLTPVQREYEATKKYKAIFIIGIGANLPTGEVHGERGSDADDWISSSENGLPGLNGDLIVWNRVLQQPLELSSMGIRVDKQAFYNQAKILNCLDVANMPWQKRFLNDEFPLTIGGGIGISRTCMFLLQKAHIGEVQPGVWPEKMVEKCNAANIHLL